MSYHAQSTPKTLRISWARIVKEFEIRFDEVFLNTQTKAHLDVCLQIIDGAKGITIIIITIITTTIIITTIIVTIIITNTVTINTTTIITTITNINFRKMV